MNKSIEQIEIYLKIIGFAKNPSLDIWENNIVGIRLTTEVIFSSLFSIITNNYTDMNISKILSVIKSYENMFIIKKCNCDIDTLMLVGCQCDDTNRASK